MGEKAQQESYVKKIASSDNNANINSSEQIAIEFLRVQKTHMPEMYFQTLLNKTLAILERKKSEELDIRKECEVALQELSLQISADPAIRIRDTEQFLIQKLEIQETEWLSMDEIIKKIRTKSVDDIKEISKFLSAKFDGSFCPSLFNNQQITIQELHMKLNQIQIEKQKDLLNTKMFAFIESKWKTKEEAQKIVNEIINPTDEQKWEFNVCNTSILQHILKVLNNHGVKDIDFKDKDSLVDIIQIKVDIEKSKNDWKLQSIILRTGISQEDIESVKTEEDALKLAAVNKLNPEETQQLLQELQREQQIKKQQENAEILKNTSKAEFDYLISTLQNGGDPKTVMQWVKIMQEERLNQERQDSNSVTKLVRHRRIDNLEVGETTTYSLSRDNRTEWNMVRITNAGEGIYELQVADHDRVRLTQKETEWYLKSFRFLENSGLGYLVQAIRPDRLSRIIALAWKNGNRVDNKDGDFTEDERFRFLKILGQVLGVKDIERAINFSQTREYFNRAFCLQWDMIDGGFKKMACNMGLIQNGSLNIDELERRIKKEEKVKMGG